MKILVIGGSGLIGKKLGQRLQDAGHQVVSASPSTGVNTLTGDGLAMAIEGAQVTIDVSNSPSFEDNAVLHFFQTSTANLLRAAADAGVAHYIILSVAGADRIPDSGYMRAKLVQEDAVKKSGIPYTILRATQFFEFIGAIAESGADGDLLRLTTASFQPIAAEDVAAELARIALSPPINATVDIAGPESAPLAEFAKRWLKAKQDSRNVVADKAARYFGALLEDRSLVPLRESRTGAIRFEEWVPR
ncbi:MAG: SDR family oxidoreductase [Acidobacteria bacterium]|nr:SDR family oxidoreductase [Acidobacteriota bacterium]